jgi:PAS domain S-box-containing protein
MSFSPLLCHDDRAVCTALGMDPAKILIVDDHEAVRKSIRALLSLRSEWAVCGEAEDGVEALEKARSLLPDLVLMDVSMPRMNGVEAARRIRGEMPGIEVIVISQNDPNLVSRQAADAGASSYIPKSELGKRLLPAIEKVISRPPEKKREATDLLAAIVDSSDDAIISKNLDGVITSWNKSAEHMFGYSAAEAIGRNITLIIPDERREEEVDIITRLKRGTRIDHFHTVRRHKDGAMLDVSLTISPVRNASGRIVGASKVARDVTAQKRAEQERRASVERFRAIVETSPECVKVVANDGTLLHMNSSGLRMVAASEEEVVGTNTYDLVAPEHREQFRAFNQHICAGNRGSLEFDIIGLSGERRHMESHSAPLCNPDGTISQLAITRDVTDRKQAEGRERQIVAEIVATTAKFRALFEQTTQFAGIMNREGVLIDANNLSLKACGYQAHEVLGKLFWQTAWWREFPESQAKIRAAIAPAARGIPYRETLEYSLSDGTHRLVDFALYPILDESGNVLFLHPTGVDITEIKRTEANYRKLAQSLEDEVMARTLQLENRSAEVMRQSELLRLFSQRLLHAQDEERRHVARELHDSAGQTLTVLGINVAQFIQKAKQLAPELINDAEQMEATVQQLHRDIRTTSYLLHPPLLDESGLFSALQWYVQGLIERSGLEITLDISEHFGRLPRDLEIAVFRLVQEALTNIHRHSSSKTASIRVARENGGVLADIRDLGKGMSAEKLAEIQSGGSGLGIRGMRERLRPFHGTLNIQSDHNGTSILATIPISPAVAGREQTPLKAAG